MLRTRQGLTQVAASKRRGAPDFRTLSHWETARKWPSLRLLVPYLHSLGLDLIDLQAALDQLVGDESRTATAERLAGLAARVHLLENLSGNVENLAESVAALEGLPGAVDRLVGSVAALEARVERLEP